MTGLEWAAIAAIGGLVSSGVAAIGAISQGNAEAAANEQNAKNLEASAKITRQQGSARAERIRAQARALQAEQRAALGESGLIAGTGTNLDLVKDTAANLELDAMTEQYNADMDALGLTNQAALSRQAGKAASTSGYYSAAGAVFRGVTDYAKWQTRPTATVANKQNAELVG